MKKKNLFKKFSCLVQKSKFEFYKKLKSQFTKKGSRGKRSINTLDSSLIMEVPVSSDNMDANEEGGDWPEFTQSFYDFQRNVRAPKGFFGMRGKKAYSNAEKRALMGYQQVRICMPI